MSNDFEVPSKYKHIKMLLLVILAIVAAIGGVTNGDQLFPTNGNATTQTEEAATPTAEKPSVFSSGETAESPEKPTVATSPEKPTTTPRTEAPKNNNNEELSYKGKKVVLTRHAKCRSECRKIDRIEIGEVLKDGKINYRKSNPNAKPCPTFSLEGKSHDGQTCRVVIADCDNEVRVITVIDLKNKYECYCK